MNSVSSPRTITTSYCIYLSIYIHILVAQLCPTPWDPIDCSLPDSSVHGINQARILEWVAISFSRGSSKPRDQIQVSCTAGRLFTVWATRGSWDLPNPEIKPTLPVSLTLAGRFFITAPPGKPIWYMVGAWEMHTEWVIEWNFLLATSPIITAQ